MRNNAYCYLGGLLVFALLSAPCGMADFSPSLEEVPGA